MIKVGARQTCKPIQRRFQTGNGQTRPYAALDNHLVVRSPPCNHAIGRTGFVTPSTASKTPFYCVSATDRRRPNPHSV